MAGLDPDDPKYVVARALKAVEDFKARQAAEDAAAIIRAEQEAISAQLAEQAAAIIRAEHEAAAEQAAVMIQASLPPPLPNTLAGRLAAELRAQYGERRPAATNKRIAAELRKRGVEFSDRTLDSALALAWP